MGQIVRQASGVLRSDHRSDRGELRIASRQREETASAAVELALVLPLVLFAALALLQVGLLTKDAVAVVHAAREGAREASVSNDEGRVRQAVLRGGALSDDRTVVAVERGGNVGDPVTVTIRYRAPIVVPFVEWLFPEEVTLRSAVTMRQETE